MIHHLLTLGIYLMLGAILWRLWRLALLVARWACEPCGIDWQPCGESLADIAHEPHGNRILRRVAERCGDDAELYVEAGEWN